MVLRRYTPPTCTLEIVAKDSPLSRWAGRPMLKQLRFELHFDDPRQPEEKRVTILGDRAKLEALYEAVTTYVQDFLGAEAEPNLKLLPLDFGLDSADETGEQAPEAFLPDRPKSDLPRPPWEKESIQPLKSPALPDESPLPAELNLSSAEQFQEELELEDSSEQGAHLPATIFQSPHLEPRGLLSHALFLGQLATEKTGPVIYLSVLQLFDLATALDEYAAEVVALPTLGRTSWLKNPPAWTRSAAMFLVAVGLTTAVIKLFERSSTVQSVAPKSNTQPSGIPPASLTPTPSPPEAIGVPTPPAIALQPSPTAVPSPFPSAAVTPVTPPPPPINSAPFQLPASSPPTSQAPVVISGDQMAVNPRTAPAQGAARANEGAYPSSAAPAPSARTTAGNRSNASEGAQASQRASSIPSTPPSLPSPPPLKRPTSADSASADEIRETPVGNRATGRSVESQSTPQIAAIPGGVAPAELSPRQSGSGLPASLPAGSDSNLQGGAIRGAAGSAEANPRPESTEQTKGKLFDTIPQVAQVRNYLQPKWRPPEGLNQDLQYYLLINANGSIDLITPLGEAATKYINSTGIPRPGEPFVSPLERGSNAKIRVVLSADGNVETFSDP